MSVINETWRQLVRRRLWPIAVLLLGGLVAVPVLLARDPAPASPVPAPPASSADGGALAKEPIVTVASADQPQRRRRVLGAAKNPFTPAPTPEPEKSDDGGSGTGGSGSASHGGTSASSSPTPSPSSPPASTPPVLVPVPAPTPAPEAPKKKTYPPDSLTVRFGGESLTRMTLKTGQALPRGTGGADDQPALVYLGPAKRGKEAVFLLDASVKAQGDGTCDSESPDTCDTLHLNAGETEFLDVVDESGEVTASYELDVVAIHARKHHARARSSKAEAKATAAGAGGHAGATAVARHAMSGAAGVARLLEAL